MSKASEWAERADAARTVFNARPSFYSEFTPDTGVTARVSDDGERCELFVRGAGQGLIPKAEALKLARWILDTFDESPRP